MNERGEAIEAGREAVHATTAKAEKNDTAVTRQCEGAAWRRVTMSKVSGRVCGGIGRAEARLFRRHTELDFQLCVGWKAKSEILLTSIR